MTWAKVEVRLTMDRCEKLHEFYCVLMNHTAHLMLVLFLFGAVLSCTGRNNCVIGPVLVNQLVLSFGSRQIAYNISISFFFICAILNGLIAFTLSADEDKVCNI